MGYIGSKPANKPITSADIEDSIITAADLGANSVDSSELVDGSIDTSHLGNLQVTTAKLAADAVDGTKLADDAVNSEHYTDGSIDTAHIADDQITLAKMASGTDGNIISYDASGNPVAIATGNDGQVLTSAGAGQPPAFEAAVGGRFVKLMSGSASSSVTHNLVGFVDTSKYNNYWVFLGNILGQSANTIDFQFADGSGAMTGADYLYSGHGWRSSDNAVNVNGEYANQIELCASMQGNANQPSFCQFYMTVNPNSNYDGKTIQGVSWGWRTDVNDVMICNVMGWQNSTHTVTGFSLHASGNDATTFDYEIYGITK